MTEIHTGALYNLRCNYRTRWHRLWLQNWNKHFFQKLKTRKSRKKTPDLGNLRNSNKFCFNSFHVNTEMSEIKEVHSEDEEELLLSQQQHRSHSIATTTLINQHQKGLFNKSLSIRNPENELENQLNQQTYSAFKIFCPAPKFGHF